MNTLLCARVAVPFVVAGLLVCGCSESSASQSSKSVAAPAPAPESPEQVVEMVMRGFSEGQPHVAWDALPGSYQRDITSMVHTFASNVDPEMWDRGFGLLRKLTTVLRNKKDIILAMPSIAQSPNFDSEKAAREWNIVVAPFETLASSELATVAGMRRMDVRRFLGTTGAAFMNDLMALETVSRGGPTKHLASLGKTKATVLTQSGETAMVRIEVPGNPAREEAFVRVEGKWIPAEMAEDWSEKIGELEVALNQMSGEDFESMRPQMMQVMASLEGVLDQLNVAETPEQFEQTMQMGMFQAFAAVMTMSQSMESAGASSN